MIFFDLSQGSVNIVYPLEDGGSVIKNSDWGSYSDESACLFEVNFHAMGHSRFNNQHSPINNQQSTINTLNITSLIAGTESKSDRRSGAQHHATRGSDSNPTPLKGKYYTLNPAGPGPNDCQM